MNLLEMLKIDLGISGKAYDERLEQIVTAARRMIAAEGASLNVTKPEDAQLVIMYASWLWRRRDTGDAMPRMLRISLNNRVLAEKMRGGTIDGQHC